LAALATAAARELTEHTGRGRKKGAFTALADLDVCLPLGPYPACLIAVRYNGGVHAAPRPAAVPLA